MPTGFYKRRSTIENFFAKVNKSDECWIFTGYLNHHGYGNFRGPDGITLAHRYSWTIHFGKIPNGLGVFHKCDNRACVNPKHLFTGTAMDNTMDMIRKGRVAKGERHSQAKLTEKVVVEIRKMNKDGFTYKDIAKKYSINTGTIWSILKKKTWGHVA